MLTVILISVLVAGPPGDAQQPTPVFHAEAYVVTNLIAFKDRDGQFTHGLTSADIQASVNKKAVVNPPAELRDGKSHRIDVKVRSGDKWHDLPIKWTAVFEKAR